MDYNEIIDVIKNTKYNKIEDTHNNYLYSTVDGVDEQIKGKSSGYVFLLDEFGNLKSYFFNFNEK